MELEPEPDDEFMTELETLFDTRDWVLIKDYEALTHLLKSALGSGIVAMPIGFKNAGLSMGVLGTVLAAAICTHTMYILVHCAHLLYVRTKVNAMKYQQVGEVAFATGPEWAKKFSRTARVIIMIAVFAAYFSTCSLYAVIVANNIQQVVEHYTNSTADPRLYVAGMLLPLIVLCWIPDLKWLVPVSMIANIFMGIGLSITVYYLVIDLPSIRDRVQFGHPYGWPQFFSIVIFSINAIGIVMPLENTMKTPRHFIGICGIGGIGMSTLCFIYAAIGFLGYFKYGDSTKGSITLNLPVEEGAAQSVKILIAIAIFFTYGIQFFVALHIILDPLKEKFPNRPILLSYTVRTSLVILSVVLAIAVPKIGPFCSLIGALCMSIVAIIVPAVIELIVYWDTGFGPLKWRLWKNVFVFMFGLMALTFGTYTSMEEIIGLYTTDDKY